MKEVINSIVGDALGKIKVELKTEFAVSRTEHFTFNFSSDLELDFVPDSELVSYSDSDEFGFNPVCVSLHNLPTYAEWANTDYSSVVDESKVMAEFKSELSSLLFKQFDGIQSSFTPENTLEENY